MGGLMAGCPVTDGWEQGSGIIRDTQWAVQGGTGGAWWEEGHHGEGSWQWPWYSGKN